MTLSPGNAALALPFREEIAGINDAACQKTGRTDTQVSRKTVRQEDQSHVARDILNEQQSSVIEIEVNWPRT